MIRLTRYGRAVGVVSVLIVGGAWGTTDLDYCTKTLRLQTYEIDQKRIPLDAKMVASPYIASDGKIYACDNEGTFYEISSDLATVQKRPMPGGCFSMPIPIDDRRLLVVGKTGTLGILDRYTGSFSTKKALPEDAVSMAAPTIATDENGKPRILIPCGNMNTYVLDDRLNVTKTIRIGGIVKKSVIPLGGRNFVAHTVLGQVVCFDAVSGKTDVIDIGEKLEAAPAVLGQKIFSFSAAGKVHTFDLRCREQGSAPDHGHRFLSDAIKQGNKLRVYDENGGVVDVDGTGKPVPLYSIESTDSRMARIQMMSRMTVIPEATVHAGLWNDGTIRLFDAPSGGVIGTLKWPNRITSNLTSGADMSAFAAEDSNLKSELVVARPNRRRPLAWWVQQIRTLCSSGESSSHQTGTR